METTELMVAVLTSDNLRTAWKRVKANKGAPGIDGIAIEDFPAYAMAVDIDLAKFFDTVNHDVLMKIIGRTIRDKAAKRGDVLFNNSLGQCLP